MVQKLTIFAIMAAIAIAAPTYDGGKHDLGYGGSTSGKVSISVSAGFTGGVAGALEACWAGATSASINVGYKHELQVWIKGAGKQYFDFLTRSEISKWCEGGDYELTVITQLAISAVLGLDAGFTAAGGAWVFLNDLIEKSHDGECACKPIDHGYQASLKAFLAGAKNGAIKKSIYGSLKVCAAGGLAETLSVEALASLKLWLGSKDCQIKGELLIAVKAWLSIGSGSGDEHYDEHHSIHGHGGLNVFLGGSYQQSLSKFCSGSVFGDLDFLIQVGLKACATGGVAGSLDTSILVALSAFVESSSCPLDLDLQASIKLWLSGKSSVGVEVGTSIDAYAYIAGGFAISGNIDISGSLNLKGQAALTEYCGAIGGSIDASILASLNICAHGGLASYLELSASAELSAWLASSHCPLSPELRALVIVWLSLGISGSGGAGVGIGAGAGLAFDHSALVAISAGISASAEISTTVKGALGVCLAGGAAGFVDLEARVELAAFLCSDLGVSVGAEVQSELMGWLCGSHKN